MSNVQLGDATIEFHAAGSGDPVVMLPAGGLDIGYLGELAERLDHGGFRAIRVNTRGVGSSRGPLEQLTLHTFAADAAGVIDALATGPAHVIGHGFSNRLVRCLVADRPNLVRSAVLLGGIGEIAREWAPFKRDAPLLVVQGLADRLAPRVDQPALREHFGNRARLVDVPRAGHMLVVEQPMLVADAVLSFLRSQ